MGMPRKYGVCPLLLLFSLFPYFFLCFFFFFHGGGGGGGGGAKAFFLVYDFYLTTGYWNNFTITSSKEKKTEQANILDYVVLS